MKLICLTYAGGNKYSYRNLKPFLDETIDFITLELPGRGSRMAEPLIKNLEELVEDLYIQIQQFLTSDYMIYGHSMGGMLGNLLLHKLQENLKPLPLHFLVTGCSSPIRRSKKRKLHQLNEIDFQEEIKRLGGMPNEVMENAELLRYVMPILRSDITAIETNIYQSKERYNVPLTAIRGTREGLNEEDMISWQEETASSFDYFSLPGDHFFINNHARYLADLINSHCTQKRRVVEKIL